MLETASLLDQPAAGHDELHTRGVRVCESAQWIRYRAEQQNLSGRLPVWPTSTDQHGLHDSGTIATAARMSIGTVFAPDLSQSARQEARSMKSRTHHSPCSFLRHRAAKAGQRRRMNLPLALIVALLVLLIAGCMPDPKSPEGFSLPDGDPQRGKETFAQLQCHACHTVSDVEFDQLEVSDEQMIALGGVTPDVKTYGDLVTSIINPSHRFALGYAEEDVRTDGASKMRTYNDEMTITQLIDLVAFLQSHYEVRAYQPTPYVPYY
jgi:mono/diheme cytochrome c family protein